MVDYVFPLHQRPSIDFESGARFFGARRSGGKRKHAGCDLLMPVGTPVLAMADGTLKRPTRKKTMLDRLSSFPPVRAKILKEAAKQVKESSAASKPASAPSTTSNTES